MKERKVLQANDLLCPFCCLLCVLFFTSNLQQLGISLLRLSFVNITLLAFLCNKYNNSRKETEKETEHPREELLCDELTPTLLKKRRKRCATCFGPEVDPS